MTDRAMQALYLLGLDPIEETIADANSYGFRNPRCCADALDQCQKVQSNTLTGNGTARYLRLTQDGKCLVRGESGGNAALLPDRKRHSVRDVPDTERGATRMSDDQNSETVTIGVELVAADWKLQTTIAAPAGPTRLLQLLPLANALADAVTSVAEQALDKQGEKISCRKGCAACCRSMIPISEVEARRLRELVESLPEARRSQVLARFAEVLRRLDQAGLLEKLGTREQWTDRENKKFQVQYFLQGIACPFLEDESCTIYRDRPASCREFLVTSPAEKCAQPTNEEVRIVKLPFQVMSALARFDCPATAERIRWVPLVLALDWAAEHPDTAAPRPGPELTRELFQHVADQQDVRVTFR